VELLLPIDPEFPLKLRGEANLPRPVISSHRLIDGYARPKGTAAMAVSVHNAFTKEL
jgi:hypothetical protein